MIYLIRFYSQNSEGTSVKIYKMCVYIYEVVGILACDQNNYGFLTNAKG